MKGSLRGAGVPRPYFALSRHRVDRVPSAEAEARYYSQHVTDRPAGPGDVARVISAVEDGSSW
jgi:hypothetical protein